MVAAGGADLFIGAVVAGIGGGAGFAFAGACAWAEIELGATGGDAPDLWVTIS